MHTYGGRFFSSTSIDQILLPAQFIWFFMSGARSVRTGCSSPERPGEKKNFIFASFSRFFEPGLKQRLEPTNLHCALNQVEECKFCLLIRVGFPPELPTWRKKNPRRLFLELEMIKYPPKRPNPLRFYTLHKRPHHGGRFSLFWSSSDISVPMEEDFLVLHQ